VGAGELGLAVEAPLAGAAVCARGAGVPHLEEPARLKPLINQSREEKKETIFRWVSSS
jgi:crotonobetainyl-CoA:carnitine CoA-transferase CaiB-like acyl-CoA transferase